MKTIINFIIICSFFVLPYFGGVGGGLYAQPQILFDHTWHFVNGELDGDAFFPTEKLTADLYIYPNDILIGYTYCEGGISFDGVVFDMVDPTFDIMGEYIYLLDLCNYPTDEDEISFMGKHNKLYMKDNQIPEYFNTFTYNIVPIDDYYQLTIENGEGNWGVYTSKLMSNPRFSQTGFALYPNPVNEILHINNTFNQTVQASIYDVNGKLLHTYNVTNNNVTIDVKSLNQGLYFVVFENETGERVSKKFIKK